MPVFVYAQIFLGNTLNNGFIVHFVIIVNYREFSSWTFDTLIKFMYVCNVCANEGNVLSSG